LLPPSVKPRRWRTGRAARSGWSRRTRSAWLAAPSAFAVDHGRARKRSGACGFGRGGDHGAPGRSRIDLEGPRRAEASCHRARTISPRWSALTKAMPTHAYRCERCGESFEQVETIREHGTLEPPCPKCGSERVASVPTASWRPPRRADRAAQLRPRKYRIGGAVLRRRERPVGRGANSLVLETRERTAPGDAPRRDVPLARAGRSSRRFMGGRAREK
jgi:putative FmdB family regulatory protein